MKYQTCLANTLADLSPGETAYVIELDRNAPLTERLEDLGMTEGAWVTCERHSLFGDPAAYRIQTARRVAGTVIALRHNDAKWVEVRRDISTEMVEQNAEALWD